MRRPALLLAPPLLALALTVPAAARAQTDRLTPRPPPTAVLPKATPVHTEPKGKAPAGLAALPPPPVVPVPLSPVTVPGEPPPAAPAPAASVPGPPPAASSAAPAAEAKAPPPPVAKPPPVAVAEAPKPAEKKGADAKPADSRPADAKPARRTVYAREGIYIRVAPGRNSRVLDTLEEGEAAELLPDKPAEEGWARIARNGKPVGWVSSRFLTDRGPDARPDGRDPDDADACALPSDLPSKRSASIAEGAAARVLADANVRQSPACNAKVLDVLEEGETVTVTGASGTWYRVARRGRTLGYVSAPLLGEARGR